MLRCQRRVITLQSQSGVTQGNNVAVSEKGNNFAACQKGIIALPCKGHNKLSVLARGNNVLEC